MTTIKYRLVRYDDAGIIHETKETDELNLLNDLQEFLKNTYLNETVDIEKFVKGKWKVLKSKTYTK